MKFGKIFITSLFLLSTFTITAQKGVEDGSKYGHGEDSIRCLKNLSLYRQYRKMKMFKDALPFWRIVAKECPRSSKNIFIDGPVIYQHLIENTEDKEKKQAYVDTLMQVYDMRIKYYPDEKGYILGRKAVDLFKYDNQNI